MMAIKSDSLIPESALFSLDSGLGVVVYCTGTNRVVGTGAGGNVLAVVTPVDLTESQAGGTI